MYTKTPSTSGSPVPPARDKALDQFDHFADKAADVTHQAEQLASRVAEQGQIAGEKMKAVAGNLKEAVDKSVKDQPMATLAMIAVAGFVLGAIWKA